MMINGKQIRNMVLTFWDNGKTPRIMLIDEGEALVLEWDKKQAVSECYTYDPVKLEFKETKGKKTPFVATYKTGEILKGTLHRDRFNEWEQKEYNRRMEHKRSSALLIAEAEQQAKERAEITQEQREANRALIRLAGLPDGNDTPIQRGAWAIRNSITSSKVGELVEIGNRKFNVKGEECWKLLRAMIASDDPEGWTKLETRAKTKFGKALIRDYIEVGGENKSPLYRITARAVKPKPREKKVEKTYTEEELKTKRAEALKNRP
jgi:hypothetical protein